MDIVHEFVILSEKIPCHLFWATIYSIVNPTGKTSKKYKVNGLTIKSENIYKYLSNKELRFLELEEPELSFRLHFNGSTGCYFVHMNGTSKATLDEYVHGYSKLGKFVMGRTYDSDYEMWQNMKDPGLYLNLGGPKKDLIIEEINELKLIVTSSNPGREILHKGYVEAVGSTMWLGDAFFELTGSDKNRIKSTDWLKVSEDDLGILKIVAQEAPFTMDQGKEAEIQNSMRDLLFPNHE